MPSPIRGKLFVTCASYRDDLHVSEGLVLTACTAVARSGRSGPAARATSRSFILLISPMRYSSICEDDRALAVGRIRAAADQLRDQAGELNDTGVLLPYVQPARVFETIQTWPVTPSCPRRLASPEIRRRRSPSLHRSIGTARSRRVSAGQCRPPRRRRIRCPA